MSEDTRSVNPSNPAPLIFVDVWLAWWAGRRLVITGTLTCVVVAIIVSLLLPNTYESSATLLLLPPPFKERGPDVRTDKTDPVGMFSKLLSATDYSALLKDDVVLLKVVDRLKEKGLYPADIIGKLAQPSVLQRKMNVETRVVEKTTSRTEYSPVVRLTARGASPELARDLAQAWADVAVEEAGKFYKKEGPGLSGFFDKEYSQIQKDLDIVFVKQREVESAWHEESSREQLVGKAVLLTKLEDDRARAFADMEDMRKQVEDLTARLTQEKPTLTLWKSPPATALFLAGSANPPQGAGAPDDKTKGYYEEVVNETFLYVSQELANRQATLKGLEEREKSLRQSIEGTQKELQTLREEAARYGYESKSLLRQSDAYTRGFDVLADKLRQAEIAESEQANLNDLKLVAAAVAPDKKVAPQRTLIVLAALVLGGGVSSVAAVLKRFVAKAVTG